MSYEVRGNGMYLELKATRLLRLICQNGFLGLTLSLTVASLPALAEPLTLTKVTDQVYSAIGEPAPPSYENAGHNNNLSVVVSDAGILVVNGGANYLLAKNLHKAIKQVSDQPVLWVVNENGQGHAFLGNSAQLTVRTMDDRKRPIFLFLHAANTIVGITCRKHVRSVSAS